LNIVYMFSIGCIWLYKENDYIKEIVFIK